MPHSSILLCVCVSFCPPHTLQSVLESLQRELCPSFLLPSSPGEKLHSFLRHQLVLYFYCSNEETRPRESSCTAQLQQCLLCTCVYQALGIDTGKMTPAQCLSYMLGGEIRDIHRETTWESRENTHGESSHTHVCICKRQAGKKFIQVL